MSTHTIVVEARDSLASVALKPSEKRALRVLAARRNTTVSGVIYGLISRELSPPTNATETEK